MEGRCDGMRLGWLLGHGRGSDVGLRVGCALGWEEVDGTGVRESSEHNLVIRANTIDVNEIIHNGPL